MSSYFSSAVLLSALSLSIVGCSRDDPLIVRILPNRYEVAGIASELATPVVDEVVRRKPRRVHVFVCESTPAKRHVQFITELQARHKADIAGGLLEERECQ
ncbi:hypothetical protein PEC18_07855 [Paucibacter sp. O1-1]|nr:hypothetical protein [Paucibacter sp. O1-1]MDA3825780.1 hypothetical protein [Paucibacter sp. O1-1]